MRLSILTSVTIRVLGILALLSTLALLPMQSARAVTTETLNCSQQYQIVQTFANLAKWEMCWEPRAGYGYQLRQVIFTPPNGIRRKVLHSTHVAQLFVPYDDGEVRYHDIAFGTQLAVLTAAECPGGSLLTNSTLCLVRRPAGYLFKNTSAGNSVQGDSFAVFGYYGLGQYYYTFQYTFFDDGSIEPAVLASGSLQRYSNSSPKTTWPVADQGAVNHNHFVIWRLDFDLDGSANNLVERVSFSGAGTDQRNMTITPLTTEIKETNNLTNAVFWRVRNTAENNEDGRSVSYEIEPNVTSHLRAPEDFTRYDFYLTQYKSTEELVDPGLVGYVNGETVTDVVLWYGVNFHHTPRGEDDIRMPAHSQGFRIRPRDVSITSAANPVNQSPTITNPGAQTTPVNTSVNLQISAADADVGDILSYSASGLPAGLSINSATGLISGTTPATAGSYTATVTISDGRGGTASASFGWTVGASGGSGTQTFSAPAFITIRDNATAIPYPASVTVAGMSGAISKVAVTLNTLSHTYPADLDVLLVGPGGQKVMLMSDAGGGTAVSNVNVSFDAAATVAVPQSTVITTGTYRPTNYTIGSTDAFPAPGPAAPYPTDLAVFNGTSPNGTWNLFVFDDAGGDVGQIANGFSLSITTAATSTAMPSVSSSAAGSISSSGATLNGSVNPNGQATTSWFRYANANPGTCNDTFGTQVPSAGTSRGSGTANVSYSHPLTGLAASTTYYFCAIAQNATGKAFGSVLSFTTTAAGGSTQSFSAPAAITINDNAAATPYPASVSVAGMSGSISKVVVALKGLTHTYPADLDVLLVGPGGQKVMLMSDAGGGADVSNVNVTLDTAATVAVPQSTVITTGTYRPTDYTIGSTADAFPAPGPAAPYPTDLAVFNGTSPNGAWKVFVLDDAGSDVGKIENGVTLTITTQ